MSNRQAAKDEFARLQAEYGLTEWKLVFNDWFTTSLGRCQHKAKVIEIGTWGLKLETAQVIDTVRHEIAHALAPEREGHGSEWKYWCRVVGANPDREADVAAALIPGRKDGFNWRPVCPEHGVLDGGWFGKPYDNKIHRNCGLKVEILSREQVERFYGAEGSV